MFGTKLRTWMEAHIVRSKKKKDRKKGDKGFDSNCNSPRNRSANRSPCLHQVHPAESPEKTVDGIRLHGGGSYATASASSGTSAGTGSVNLSSPESAYSTGYSTDGTSPGASFPPEYYINIRTGTHYFQSNGNNVRPKKSAGTGAGELPVGGTLGSSTGSGSGSGSGLGLGLGSGPVSVPGPGTGAGSGGALLAGHGILEAAACLASMTRKDNRSRDGRGTNAPNKISERLGGEESREEQSQRARAQHQDNRYHRRTESFSGDSSKSNLAVPSSIPPPLVVSPSAQSPRERSRIRTNPWLSANSSGSSNAGFKSRLNLDDASNGSALKLTESSGSASDVNVNCAREARAKREFKQESLSAGRSPINQNWRIASGLEIRSKMALSMQRRSNSSSSSTRSSTSSSSNISNGNSNSGCSRSGGSSDCNGNEPAENEIESPAGKVHRQGQGHGHGSRNCNRSSASSVTRSAMSSEDDITLNEMMGKFDESYVYEKETDILSDSDPTDCEDCIDSLSDVEAGRVGAEENDPLENTEFDYIDNGSFLDLDNLDCSGRFPNTGHCTYFAFTGELARRTGKLRESMTKRRGKEDASASVLQRMASAPKNVPAKRPSASGRHGKKSEEKQQQSEKRKKRTSQRRKSTATDRCDDETANLNRALLERMLLKNSGFNQQGSRSVGGTPICLRRKKHDVNKNLSPVRLNAAERSSVHPIGIGVGVGVGVGIGGAVDLETVKRRSNSVSYVNGNIVGRRISSSGSAYMTAFASEIALIEADKEADKKCRELILEAENILVTMQKSQNGGLPLPVVPSPSRKFHNGLANKRVELIKNTELNIELALSKSRNSQPELQSGSIRDLEHTSPKRQFAQQPCSPIRRFVERNGPAANELRGSFRQETTPLKYFAGDSPIAARRTPPLHSPGKPLFRTVRRESDPETVPSPNPDRRPEAETERCSPMEVKTTLAAQSMDCNGVRRISSESETIHPEVRSQNRPRPVLPSARRNDADGTDGHATRSLAKEELILSSSSDSEEKCDVRRRPTLMTFRSVDMGPTKEGSFYCPQSEPVKRKVYAGSTTYGRIQKTLGEHVALRNSDGDTATDDTDDSRRSLKEKVAQLRRERLVTVDAQDSHMLQQQMSQLRKQMLMHTIEGLKRSLEDQSATLKQTCLEPAVLSDQLP